MMQRKNLISAVVLLLMGMTVMSLNGCAAEEKKEAPSTPEATFEALVKAIQNEDIGAYKPLWSMEPAAERESMILELEADPKEWGKLKAVFHGPQKLRQGDYTEKNGKKFYQTSVEAPEAERGGIGSVVMIQEDGKWKMFRW